MASENIITRGTYSHSQISGFMSAREYIFLNRGGQKCIIIRFYNESKHTIKSFEFTLVQLSADGRVLGKSDVSYADIDVKSGSTFSTRKAIAVDPACADFEVQIKAASSAYYLFRIKQENVIAYYDRRKRSDYRPRPLSLGFSDAKTIRPGGRIAAAVMTALATVGVIAVAVLSLFLEVEGFLGLPL